MSDTENNAPADAVENTGDGSTAEPAGIEAEAAAAAAAEPAPEPEPAADPEPEPEPEKKAAGKGAAATKRKRQTSGKRGKDTAANQAHLTAKKDARPTPAPVETPAPTEEQQAAIDLKKATRERLREIKAELEALDADRKILVDEQQELANPQTADDGMTFVERHQAVLARSREIRERRVQDRLKLLAQGAARSPLDTSLAERPRQSMAATDAAAADTTE